MCLREILTLPSGRMSPIGPTTPIHLWPQATGGPIGATENAGVENAIWANMQGWKMQE